MSIAWSAQARRDLHARGHRYVAKVQALTDLKRAHVNVDCLNRSGTQFGRNDRQDAAASAKVQNGVSRQQKFIKHFLKENEIKPSKDYFTRKWPDLKEARRKYKEYLDIDKAAREVK